MIAPSREDTGPPAPIPPAPDGAATPLPGSFRLTMDPMTTVLDDGSVLMGGSPFRLLRLSPRARVVVGQWAAGARVGQRRGRQLLARRLVSSGTFNPQPSEASHGPGDVTVVIPVRNRADQLQRLLSLLDGLSCVVVDDASSDPARTEAIALSFDARFIGLTANAGPSGARNAGLDIVSTPLVAFVDSDCEPTADWLSPLLGHFDDPMVAAVAPRIVPAPVSPPTWLSRYEAVRSSLDRGEREGLVRPHTAIPYVPSATIVVRRRVAGTSLFDPTLRGGEDVDVVWRLVAAGWDVRYVPTSTVAHAGPDTTRSWVTRRAFYGTTAGPLSRRHPDALAPLRTSAWSAATWGLLASRRPVLAAGTLAAPILMLAHRLRGLVDEPLTVASRIAGGGTARSALPALSGLTRAWSPALALGLLFGRTRRAAALALIAPALNDLVSAPGDLDPVRYTALHVADDLAYGAGVWRGCVHARTLRPLIPHIVLRARGWSPSSLRTQLGGAEKGENDEDQENDGAIEAE
jgi:mycofactocin system glycosyltransferase